MPYTTNVAGTTITAAWGNANVRDQVITPFTGAAARDSAITAPVEGMAAFQTDTDTFVAYNGSSWVEWGTIGAWTTWTPQIDQGASTNISKTIDYARYRKRGRQITAQVRLALTGSGTAGAAIQMSIPFTPVNSSGLPVGQGWLYDASSGFRYQGIAVFSASDRIAMYSTSGNPADPSLGVASFTAALASGDAWLVCFDYEATS